MEEKKPSGKSANGAKPVPRKAARKPAKEPAAKKRAKPETPLEKREPNIANLIRMRANAIIPRSKAAEELLKKAGYVRVKSNGVAVYYRQDIAKRIAGTR